MSEAEERTRVEVLQERLFDWQKRTYPMSNVWTDIAGIAEEFGELASTQINIFVGRETEGFEDNEEAMKDAIGDMMVYLGQLAAKHGLSLEECYEHAADEVTDDESRHG